MRPPSPPWPRRTASLAIAALAALALPQTVALAADAVPASPDPSRPAESPLGASAQLGRCEAELTTFSRAGVSGQARAVSLTAQAIDRDADGWLLLAWQVADGTHLTDVLATAPDGTVRHLDPTPTGTVDHVTTLTFCGTHTTPDPTTDPAASAERREQGRRGDTTTGTPDAPPITTPSDRSPEHPSEAPAATSSNSSTERPTETDTTTPPDAPHSADLAGCDDPLVEFSPDEVSGQARAVALTAQAMDRDTDGWLLLAWQVADGTHLTDVLATAPDGTVRHLDPTPTGTVDHVTTLTFCGTHTAPETTPDPAAAPPAPRDATTSTAPATPAGPAAETAVTGAGPAPARDDAPDALGETPGRSADDARGDDLPRRSDGDGDGAGNGEVLGVRLISPLTASGLDSNQVLGQGEGTAGEEAGALALTGSERPAATLHLWLLTAAAGAGLAAARSLLRARARARANRVTSPNPISTPDGPEAGP